jgi:predicted enzyme related to lactoylglutathione lyase
MAIQSVAFVVMPVSDMARARKFYEDALGFSNGVGNEQFIEYDVNGVTIAVADAREWQSCPPGQGLGLVLEVDNVDAMVDKLTAAGAPVILPAFDTPVCRMAGLKDPDGNSFFVHQCKPSHKG